jgi:hypothetical protein
MARADRRTVDVALSIMSLYGSLPNHGAGGYLAKFVGDPG